jgi:glyceraldehyde 3-phosphate dehydrogenase
MSINNIVYLLNHDSIYGKSNYSFKAIDDTTIICSEISELAIHCFHENDISKSSWFEMGADIVVDCSGKTFSIEARDCVVKQGVKHLLITNWTHNADQIFVYGYSNPNILSKKAQIISTGICDSAAIAPVIKEINEHFSITHLAAVTLHPWLNYQNLLGGIVLGAVRYNDSKQEHFQLGRQAFDNLIPKPTSLSQVLTELFPNLKDKIQIMAYRIPTDTVSSAELFITIKESSSLEQVIDILNSIPDDVIGKNSELLVSKDFSAMQQAGVLDYNWISVCGNTIHLTIWYDNEWGYVSAVIKTLRLLSEG